MNDGLRGERLATMRRLLAGAFAIDARRFWAVLLLVAFPVLLHWPLWSGWLKGDAAIWFSGLASGVTAGPSTSLPTIDPNIAFTSQALGMRAAQDWLHGHIPWWNPFEATGVPLAGEMQSAALFLPWILLLALPGGQLWFHILLEITAGLGTYLLLRRLQLGRLASVCGGLLFEVNGTYAWLANAVVNPIAFLPWLLLGIEMLYRANRDGQPREGTVGGAIVAVALAESLYAGFPEVAYLDGLLALAWALMRFGQLREGHWRYALGLVMTGVIGLLLAMPAVLPFLEYLPHAFVGGHAGGFTHSHQGLWSLPALALPYVFGGVWTDTNVGNIGVFWAGIGGYLTVGLIAAGIVGLFSRREILLRWVLFAWILLTLLKTYGQAQATSIINFIPLINDAAFARYIWPSVWLAAVILTAFGIEAAREYLQARTFMVATAFAVGVVIWLITPGFSVVGELLKGHEHYVAWLFGSLLIMGVVLAAWALGALWSPQQRAHLYAFVLVAEAGLYFFLPMLANPRHGRLDVGGVHYLQTHLGSQRFYTLGPIQPNYGSAWGIAQINYNDLPIATSIVNFVHRKLDPYADPVSYTGNYHSMSGVETPVQVLRKNLQAYEAAGVAYVVAPRGPNPFQRTVSGKTQDHGNIPLVLSRGQSLSFVVSDIPAGTLRASAVMIGTYAGKSDGELRIRVCISGQCSDGSRPLKQALDNHLFQVPLAHPLTVSKGASVDVRVTHVSGTYPVAVWLWPLSGQSEQALTEPRKKGYGVRYALAYQTSGVMPQRVYADAVMDIYRLPHPAPYFQAGGCKLRPSGRERVTAICSGASTLVRLETDLPGWRASVKGRAAGISRVEGLFQGVALPEGRSVVRFVYRPVHFGLIVGCFWGALLALLGWIYLGFRRRSAGAGI